MKEIRSKIYLFSLFNRSQNDSLKAEIEAQAAAHKAQIGAADQRAHESWLSARQTERRLEESRTEASTLRRKLTSIVGGGPAAVVNNIENRKEPFLSFFRIYFLIFVLIYRSKFSRWNTK